MQQAPVEGPQQIACLVAVLGRAELAGDVTQAVNCLACGHWEEGAWIHPSVPEKFKYIIKRLEVKGLRVIWMVDVDQDTRTQVGGLCTGMLHHPCLSGS
jgi:hypothetical protein